MTDPITIRVRLSADDWLILDEPETILEAREPEDVPRLLEELERVT